MPKLTHLAFISMICLILPRWSIAKESAIACGGYIKSTISSEGKAIAQKLQYQRLNVHLVLPDGSLRYVTDILPNGAYSMPIYDKGNYRLKLEAPDGWNFEPVEGYPISVADQDSCNADYNFFFKGYAVKAKVVTKGSEVGPSGLAMELYQGHKLTQNSLPISECTSQEGGLCVFSSVIPGNYLLRVRTDATQQWKFQREEIPITVVNDVVVPEHFKITGFQVEGLVTSNGKPISGVKIHLFSSSVVSSDIDFDACKCDPKSAPLAFPSDNSSLVPLCQTISDSKGIFIFNLLPAGEFTLFPYYKSDKIVFDVKPSEMAFKVTNSNLKLGLVFQVSGFSPSGHVYLSAANKTPISDAKILVNNEHITETDANGQYTLRSMSFGEFELQVLSEHVIFQPRKVSLTVNQPTLPDMMPSKFAICGSITLDKVNDPNLVKGRSVQFLSAFQDTTSMDENIVLTVQTQNTLGEFCALLPPGQYLVRPVVSKDEETNLGLRLAPLQMPVKLVDRPLFGLKFSQFRATLAGGIQCLEPCPTGVWEVTLKPSQESGIQSSRLGTPQTVTQHIKIAKSALVGDFHFVDVIPGKYDLDLHPATVDSLAASAQVISPGWCWQETHIPVLVEDRNIKEGLQFIQIGYQLTVMSSHNITLQYEHVQKVDATVASSNETTETLKGQWNVSPGTIHLCVPEPGEYHLHAQSCHHLQQTEFNFHTSSNSGQNIELSTREHQVNVRLVQVGDVVLPEGNQGEIVVHIAHDGATERNEQRTVKLTKLITGEIAADISLWLPVGGNSARISPESPIFLFSPSSVVVSAGVGLECLPTVATIQVEKGEFVTGELVPPMEGVEVKLFTTNAPAEPLFTLRTDKAGRFQVGPLKSVGKTDSKEPPYRVEVSLDGYEFSKMSGDQSSSSGDYHFVYQVSKLAEVVVNVLDEEQNPLADVLISIVGDDYRSNDHTNEQGKVTFLGLSQGVYYIRAMMKEYTFQPTGAIEVQVEEGKTVTQALHGKRSAYSIFGQVTSLNREPEVGMLIEAREIGPIPGQENDPLVQQFCPKTSPSHKRRIEQAVSNSTGKFRLRGLIPGCEYSVSLRTDGTINHAIDRAVPSNSLVSMKNEDYYDVNFVAFRRLNIMDISAYVHTSDEHLKSLYLLLYPTNNPDYILKRHSFATDSLYFVMSGLALYTTTTTHSDIDETGPKDVVHYQPRSYTLRLESTLNPAHFTDISPQEVILTANTSARGYQEKHCQFYFYPVPKLASEQEVPVNLYSILTLPLVVLFATLVYLNWASLMPLLRSFLTQLSSFSRIPLPLSARKAVSKQESGKDLDASEIQSLNSFVVKRAGIPISQSTTTKSQSTWFKSRR